jgi:hypothetical protein
MSSTFGPVSKIPFLRLFWKFFSPHTHFWLLKTPKFLHYCRLRPHLTSTFGEFVEVSTHVIFKRGFVEVSGVEVPGYYVSVESNVFVIFLKGDSSTYSFWTLKNIKMYVLFLTSPSDNFNIWGIRRSPRRRNFFTGFCWSIRCRSPRILRYVNQKINILEIGFSNGCRLDKLYNMLPNNNYYGIDPSKWCNLTRKQKL